MSENTKILALKNTTTLILLYLPEVVCTVVISVVVASGDVVTTVVCSVEVGPTVVVPAVVVDKRLVETSVLVGAPVKYCTD